MGNELQQLPIKNWRQIKGMTQKDVADKLGIAAKTVIHWEKETTELSNVTVYALAKLYDIEVDDIKV
ncbi:XRE family transcriptional regulator [Macrococcoides goetzii]|uniref:XRE family transcriptional regulator n=1 Tax=Macrococcoides goetzii TaxID=1891097 RepID=A0A364JKW7_9STAP|nr:helix-turn-helix transcriptional regulator [Macrococcus goetzii]RAI79334.1 XRE family transcriptional regulator [Macrococcus goetzii]